MESKIQEFLEELRKDFIENQEGTSRLINTAHYEGDKKTELELIQAKKTRANAMSDVLIALNNVGLITNDEDEKQAELFGID